FQIVEIDDQIVGAGATHAERFQPVLAGLFEQTRQQQAVPLAEREIGDPILAEIVDDRVAVRALAAAISVVPIAAAASQTEDVVAVAARERVPTSPAG